MNLDDFSPAVFYSTTTEIRHERVTDMNAFELEFLEYQARFIKTFCRC